MVDEQMELLQSKFAAAPFVCFPVKKSRGTIDHWGTVQKKPVDNCGRRIYNNINVNVIYFPFQLTNGRVDWRIISFGFSTCLTVAEKPSLISRYREVTIKEAICSLETSTEVRGKG